MGKFLVWLPHKKSNHGRSSSACVSHSSKLKNNWPLVSLRTFPRRAVLLAVLQVTHSCPAGYDIYDLLIDRTITPYAMKVPVNHEARMWLAISSDVLSTNKPQHSIVIALGLAIPFSSRTH